MDQSHDMGTKLTVVLGVDCIGSSWIRIRDENLNEEGWLDYLTHDVLPFCGPNRVLLYDKAQGKSQFYKKNQMPPLCIKVSTLPSQNRHPVTRAG